MGAKHILVLDRDPKRKRTVEWMRQHAYVDYLMPDSANVRIEIVRADVAVYSDVVDALGQVKALGLPPIGSVFHLAGILDDKFVSDMDRASFARVYAPKADGAWNLHRATQKLEPLDHFVMLSSTSSAFGNPGQTNYSAANSYQDGLAAMRQQAGLAGLSYCMGAVIEAGMAARNPQLLNMMKAGGMPAISSIFAIEVLDSAIRSGVHSNAVAALASRGGDQATSRRKVVNELSFVRAHGWEGRRGGAVVDTLGSRCHKPLKLNLAGLARPANIHDEARVGSGLVLHSQTRELLKSGNGIRPRESLQAAGLGGHNGNIGAPVAGINVEVSVEIADVEELFDKVGGNVPLALQLTHRGRSLGGRFVRFRRCHGQRPFFLARFLPMGC
jgi:hypothetical protein